MACILLGVTGSIAAFRAPDIASALVKRGHDVRVIMTPSARDFITPTSMQVMSRNPVTCSLSEENGSWHPGHIELADMADLLLVAPATAATLARFAHGLAEDALSAIYLATLAPLLCAPAMNGKMWLHPATRANVHTLRERGAKFIGPDEGMLACGYEGVGRMWPVDGVIEAAEAVLRGEDPA